VGASKNNVEIWDAERSSRVGAFSTVLDFGGQRLCLDGAGSRCIAGAYNRFGVVGYDASNGNVLWSRPDIKRVQYLSRAADGGRLFVGVADGPALLIDADDGKTLEKLRGVRRVFEDAATMARLLDRTNPIVEVASGRSFPVERTTFAILDVAFGPTTFCLSESGGPTRCLDLENGREVWRYQPAHGEHVLSVTFCRSAAAFVAVSREYAGTFEHTLVHLGSGGAVRRLAALGRPAVAEFCLSGEALALADGRLFKASTGALLRTIPFVEGAG